MRHNGIFRLAGARTTLAERFRDAGYATGRGRRRGRARRAASGSTRASTTTTTTSARGAPPRPDTPSAARTRSRTPRSAGSRAWTGPFFLFVHYYDPHADYEPPAPFAERFRGRPYDGEIAYVDAPSGGSSTRSARSGRVERTVVAVTADHGESLGEHGERTHGYTLYDATLTVPLDPARPGRPARSHRPGRREPRRSVAPTLLALAGLAPLAESRRRAISAALRPARAAATAGAAARAGEAEPGSDGAAYAETLATQLDHGWAPLYALRTARHHYVRAPRAELYDVAADPRERENLLDEGVAGTEAELVDASIGPRCSRGASPSGCARRRRAPWSSSAPSATRSRTRPVAATGSIRRTASASSRCTSRRAPRSSRDGSTRPRRRRARSSPRAPGAGRRSCSSPASSARRGRTREALALAERATALLPQSAAFHAQVADWRVELGDAPGAVAAYDAALAVDPEFAEAHAGAMWRAKLSGDLADAEAAAARALAIRPDDAALQLRVADAFDRLGAAESALAAYEAALRLDPAGLAGPHGRGDPARAPRPRGRGRAPTSPPRARTARTRT